MSYTDDDTYVCVSWWPTFEGYPIVLVNEGPSQLEAIAMTPLDLADELAHARQCDSDRPGFQRFVARSGKFTVCLDWKGRETAIAGLFTDYAVVLGGEPACLVWHAKPTGR